MPEPSAFEVELAIEKLNSHLRPDTDQIPAEMIKAGDRIIHYEIRKLIISIWNKEELSEEWNESIVVIRRAIKQIVVIIGAYHVCQLLTQHYPSSCSQG